MKYDFSTFHLRNNRDAVMKTSDEDATPWTALAALKDAVLVDAQENQANKVQRYELYLKLRDHLPDTEYTVEEVGLLKKAALALPTIFAGQLSRLLDQKTLTIN